MQKSRLNISEILCFIFLFFLINAFNTFAQERKVNIASPLEDVSYNRSTQNEVLITLKLREAKTGEQSAPISRFSITGFKITDDSKRSGLVSNAPREPNSLEYNFVIPISTTPDVQPGPIFRLSPNWKSFNFSFEYEFTAGGAATKRVSGPSFTALRNFIEPVATKTVTATIEPPKLIEGNKLSVPVRIEDEDMVVDVELYEQPNTLVARGGGFLERKEKKVVILTKDPRFNITPGTNYQVRIKPRFRTDIEFNNKTREWTAVEPIPSYNIVTASSSDLKNLKFYTSEEPFKFKVQTQGGSGTLAMVIDGIKNEIQAKSTLDGLHNFEIDPATLRALQEGGTNFRFKGASSLGVELEEANQTFKLYKDTSTRLVGITSLKIQTTDKGKFLQVDFQLSRKINSQVQIDDGVSIPATFKSGDQASSYSYTASIELNAAGTLNALLTAIARTGTGSAPVKFGIIETVNGSPVTIGGFRVDAFSAPQPKDKDQLVKLIKDAADMFKKNQGEQAMTVIKTALGLENVTAPNPVDQNVISQVASQLRQDNGQSGREKALAIIGSIGRVALNLFGIPVPITAPRP
jgi:hypothetical protein